MELLLSLFNPTEVIYNYIYKLILTINIVGLVLRRKWKTSYYYNKS